MDHRGTERRGGCRVLIVVLVCVSMLSSSFGRAGEDAEARALISRPHPSPSARKVLCFAVGTPPAS